MTCPHCGKELPENSKFCGICGAQLAVAAAPAKKRSPLLLILLIAAAVAVIAAVVALVVVFGGGEDDNKPLYGTGTVVDSDAAEEQGSAEQSDSEEESESDALPEPLPEPEPEPEPEPVGPILPDPAAFFGGASAVEDEPADTSGWHVYYRLEIDAGWTATHEYVNLLCEKYGFTQQNYLTDTTLYLKSDLYFLDYTKGEIEPARDRYYGDGYVDFESDVFVWIQKNGRDEYTGVSVYYSNDLKVSDRGDRASTVAGSTTGSPSSSGSVGTDYTTPDFAKLPCLTCDGDKDCTRCNGYGSIKRYNGNGETIDSLCPTCHGSRKCTACNGTGTR